MQRHIATIAGKGVLRIVHDTSLDGVLVCPLRGIAVHTRIEIRGHECPQFLVLPLLRCLWRVRCQGFQGVWRQQGYRFNRILYYRDGVHF